MYGRLRRESSRTDNDPHVAFPPPFLTVICFDRANSMMSLQSDDDDDDSSSDSSDSDDSDDEGSSSSDDGDSSSSQSEWWRCCCLARGPAATCCLRRGTHRDTHWRQQRRIAALAKSARTWPALVLISQLSSDEVPAWVPFDAGLETAFFCRSWTASVWPNVAKGVRFCF